LSGRPPRAVSPSHASRRPTGAASLIWPLQRTAGNQAVVRLLTRTPTHPVPGVRQRFEASEHEVTTALTDQQAAQLARFQAAALRRWPQLTPDQRDVVTWKMIALYGPEFGADFLSYAGGSKTPNLSTDISNDPALTPAVLTARGYRRAGDAGGVPTWVHPSGREIRLLSGGGKAPDEPEPAGCTDPDVGACVTDSDDEDSCHECCDQRYGAGDPCRRTCKAGCADKL
jgi:hypothetical protein